MQGGWWAGMVAAPTHARREGRCRRLVLLIIAVVAVVASSLVVAAPVAAAEPDEGESAQLLAERYAPFVVVGQQDEPCDTDGEPFEPAPVEIVLDNPEVFLRQVGNGDPVLMNAPDAADIFDLREGWYLDFPGDALEPGCVFEQDFRRFWDGTSVVYANVAREAGRPDMIALQYWFFWYHNPAKNNHEGDWEFIQLLFDVGTVDEALDAVPVSVGYAQHTGGERSDWDDAKLERVGDRPVVYAARGSHASYFGQALYLGRSSREGFGCDNTDAPSRRLDPEVVVLPDRVSDRDDPLAWLAFQGRWGQRETGFFNGPTGPFAKDRWTEPISWSEDLRDSSVVIPAGDRFGDGVLRSFCNVVEVGSSVLTAGLRNPSVFLVGVLVAAIVAIALYRRTTWRPVVVSPLIQRRAAGQILRCGVRVWRSHPAAMLLVGLVYVPVTIITSALQALVLTVPFVDGLVDLAGARSGIAVLIALLVGGIGNLLAFVYVSTVVAGTIGSERSSGLNPTAVILSAQAVRRLIGAVLRAVVVVTALLISIVGIPWGVRQLVRYQLVPQVCALERLGDRDALRRSAELVRNHWWWTAGIVACIQLAVTVLGVGVALMILLTLTALPLWLFNVVSSIIYVVLVPVGAAAITYVYGNLAATQDTA